MPYKDKEKARAANRDYYSKNAATVIARTTAYQKKQDSAKKREWHLRHKYNMEPGDYEQLLTTQGGGCAICGSKEKLNVDHCHSNGHVRGILCFECNIGLGMFKDCTTKLTKAIEYLQVDITGKGGSCGI